MTLYVDGEFNSTNRAISWITLALMAALNRERAVIRGTQQCYLKVSYSSDIVHIDVLYNLSIRYIYITHKSNFRNMKLFKEEHVLYSFSPCSAVNYKLAFFTLQLISHVPQDSPYSAHA